LDKRKTYLGSRDRRRWRKVVPVLGIPMTMMGDCSWILAISLVRERKTKMESLLLAENVLVLRDRGREDISGD
jgi:hypothetical protein